MYNWEMYSWLCIILRSVIQQAQKLVMETNDPADTRNVCMLPLFLWAKSISRINFTFDSILTTTVI